MKWTSLYTATTDFLPLKKASKNVRPEDLRGLKAFLADYPEATGYLLHGGTERLMIDTIICIPAEDFLRRLRPEGIDSPEP